MRFKHNRRAFLKMTGASPLLLPLLEPDLARAGCLATPPKRAVFVLWGNGALPGNDRNNWPAPSGTDFQLSAPLKSLESHRDDLLFFDAFNYQFVFDTPPGQIFNSDPNGHYAMEGLLTGRKYMPYGVNPWDSKASGPSIDQHIGQVMATAGYQGIPSLYLGVRVLYPMYAVWRGPAASVAPDWDPPKIFARLFAGRDGIAPDPELERLRRARKSVLDSVHADFDRFRRIVGADDAARIDRHLDSIRAIEKELATVRQGPACDVPKLDLGAGGGSAAGLEVVGDGSYDVEQDKKMPAALKLHIDMLVAALATDVTRVAVLQLSDCSDHRWSMPWLGIDDSHHQTSHGLLHGVTDETGGKIRADEWIYSRWAYLIGKMKDEMEGGKSMLSSSAVAFFNNMTVGFHDCRDVPAFLAGNCGNYFKTGRSIKNTVKNGYHQPLLVSIRNAVLRDLPGVEPLTAWGDPEYNSGEMPGIKG